MSEYSEIRRKLGDDAHAIATAQFLLEEGRSAEHLIYHNLMRIPPPPREAKIRLGKWVGFNSPTAGLTEKGGTGSGLTSPLFEGHPGDAYLALVIHWLQTAKRGSDDRATKGQTGSKLPPRDPRFQTDFRGPSFAGSSRQPDLVSVDLHTIDEVKPNTKEGIQAGTEQLAEYFQLLTSADKDYVKLRAARKAARLKPWPRTLYERKLQHTVWRPREGWLPLPAPSTSLGQPVTISFSRPKPGLLVWKAEGDDDKDRPRIVAIERKLKTRLDKEGGKPASEADAEKLAEKLVREEPELVEDFKEAARQYGPTLVLLALVALLATATVVSGAVVAAWLATLSPEVIGALVAALIRLSVGPVLLARP